MWSRCNARQIQTAYHSTCRPPAADKNGGTRGVNRRGVNVTKHTEKRHHAVNEPIQTASSRQQAQAASSGSRQQAAGSKQQAAGSGGNSSRQRSRQHNSSNNNWPHRPLSRESGKEDTQQTRSRQQVADNKQQAASNKQQATASSGNNNQQAKFLSRCCSFQRTMQPSALWAHLEWRDTLGQSSPPT